MFNHISQNVQMKEAVDKNMEKVLSEKKEVDKKKEDQLKDLNPALVARIRAKEAKRIAQQMTRDPEKDKEVFDLKLIYLSDFWHKLRFSQNILFDIRIL